MQEDETSGAQREVETYETDESDAAWRALTDTELEALYGSPECDGGES